MNILPPQNPVQNNVVAGDLKHILSNTLGLWDELRGKRLFITGGTGFFGRWILESFARVNDSLGLNASALVLTRDSGAFLKAAPHIASNPAIRFQIGDVRDFVFPDGEFSHIIHAAATSAVATYNNEPSLTKFDTVVGGTRHVLDFAVRCNARKLLLTSSGAVYGRQPGDMFHMPEDYRGAPYPTDHRSAWGESKRAAELLCVLYSDRYGIETKIARCFSFVGPYLQADIHYAIGNFIRDALNGGPIRINGDGTPHRSYLYTADLMIWLWTILFKGESCLPYNVGSEEDVTIAELANIVVRRIRMPIEVSIANPAAPGRTPDRYVPLTELAQIHLGLKQTVYLSEAIDRTIAYMRSERFTVNG